MSIAFWASTTEARAESSEARAACSVATTRSNCCFDTSSFATSGSSRALSFDALSRAASDSRCRASADASFALLDSMSRDAMSTPASAFCSSARAPVNWLAAAVVFTDTPDRAPSATARASARSASAFASATWRSRGSISTRRSPAFTCWLSLTRTTATTPPTFAAIGAMCPSICASSVDCRPARCTHAATATAASTSAAGENPPRAPARRGRGGRGGH